MLNLFQEAEGRLPLDKERITAPPIKKFLSMDKPSRTLYVVGKRAGIFNRFSDLDNEILRMHAEQTISDNGINEANIDEWAAEMIRRFF